MRAFARRLWPTVMPYAQGARVNAAVITATNLRVERDSVRWEGFNVLADRDTAGQWRLRGTTEPLPRGVLGRERIFQADGSPLRIHTPRGIVERLDSTQKER